MFTMAQFLGFVEVRMITWRYAVLHACMACMVHGLLLVVLELCATLSCCFSMAQILGLVEVRIEAMLRAI